MNHLDCDFTVPTRRKAWCCRVSKRPSREFDKEWYASAAHRSIWIYVATMRKTTRPIY